MIEVATALLSIVVMLWSLASRPVVARCGPGWWLDEGVRRNGVYLCARTPVGGDHRAASGVLHDDSAQPPGVITGQIHCGEQTPIVVDDRTVGCQNTR